MASISQRSGPSFGNPDGNSFLMMERHAQQQQQAASRPRRHPSSHFSESVLARHDPPQNDAPSQLTTVSSSNLTSGETHLPLPMGLCLVSMPQVVVEQVVRIAHHAIARLFVPRLWRIAAQKRRRRASAQRTVAQDLLTNITKALLHSSEFVASIDEVRPVEVAGYLASTAVPSLYREGEIVVHQGESAASGAFVLLSGSVALYTIDPVSIEAMDENGLVSFRTGAETEATAEGSAAVGSWGEHSDRQLQRFHSRMFGYFADSVLLPSDGVPSSGADGGGGGVGTGAASRIGRRSASKIASELSKRNASSAVFSFRKNLSAEAFEGLTTGDGDPTPGVAPATTSSRPYHPKHLQFCPAKSKGLTAARFCGVVEAPYVFADLAMLNGEPRMTYAVARGTVDVVHIPRQSWIHVLQALPSPTAAVRLFSVAHAVRTMNLHRTFPLTFARLRRCSLFAFLTTDDLRAVLRIAKARVFPRGTKLARKDRVQNSIVIIRRGVVELHGFGSAASGEQAELHQPSLQHPPPQYDGRAGRGSIVMDVGGGAGAGARRLSPGSWSVAGHSSPFASSSSSTFLWEGACVGSMEAYGRRSPKYFATAVTNVDAYVILAEDLQRLVSQSELLKGRLDDAFASFKNSESNTNTNSDLYATNHSSGGGGGRSKDLRSGSLKRHGSDAFLYHHHYLTKPTAGPHHPLHQTEGSPQPLYRSALKQVEGPPSPQVPQKGAPSSSSPPALRNAMTNPRRSSVAFHLQSATDETEGSSIPAQKSPPTPPNSSAAAALSHHTLLRYHDGLLVRGSDREQIEALLPVALQHPLFQLISMPHTVLKRLLELGHRRRFDPGSPIVTRGDRCHGLMFLLGGRATVRGFLSFYESLIPPVEPPSHSLVGSFSPNASLANATSIDELPWAVGEAIGLPCLLRHPWAHSIVALDPTDVWVVPRDEVLLYFRHISRTLQAYQDEQSGKRSRANIIGHDPVAALSCGPLDSSIVSLLDPETIFCSGGSGESSRLLDDSELRVSLLPPTTTSPQEDEDETPEFSFREMHQITPTTTAGNEKGSKDGSGGTQGWVDELLMQLELFEKWVLASHRLLQPLLPIGGRSAPSQVLKSSIRRMLSVLDALVVMVPSPNVFPELRTPVVHPISHVETHILFPYVPHTAAEAEGVAVLSQKKDAPLVERQRRREVAARSAALASIRSALLAQKPSSNAALLLSSSQIGGNGNAGVPVALGRLGLRQSVQRVSTVRLATRAMQAGGNSSPESARRSLTPATTEDGSNGSGHPTPSLPPFSQTQPAHALPAPHTPLERTASPPMKSRSPSTQSSPPPQQQQKHYHHEQQRMALFEGIGNDQESAADSPVPLKHVREGTAVFSRKGTTAPSLLDSDEEEEEDEVVPQRLAHHDGVGGDSSTGGEEPSLYGGDLDEFADVANDAKQRGEGEEQRAEQREDDEEEGVILAVPELSVVPSPVKAAGAHGQRVRPTTAGVPRPPQGGGSAALRPGVRRPHSAPRPSATTGSTTTMQRFTAAPSPSQNHGSLLASVLANSPRSGNANGGCGYRWLSSSIAAPLQRVDAATVPALRAVLQDGMTQLAEAMRHRSPPKAKIRSGPRSGSAKSKSRREAVEEQFLSAMDILSCTTSSLGLS